MKLEQAQHFPRSANERAPNLGRPHLRMVTYNVGLCGSSTTRS
jgi:hypothetical protein